MQTLKFLSSVGLRRIELRLQPPHGRVLPVYDSPTEVRKSGYELWLMWNNRPREEIKYHHWDNRGDNKKKQK